MKHITQIEKAVAVQTTQKVMQGDSKLFFLFTAAQVEEVRSDIIIRPVPFAPSFLQGIALWRGHLLPVVDLEKRFSFSDRKEIGRTRFLVIRTGAPENQVGGQVIRCVLRISDNIHSIDASDASVVVNSEDVGIESSLVRGVYQWDDDMYIVPDLVSILQDQ